MARSLDDIDEPKLVSLPIKILETKEIPAWKNEGRDSEIVGRFQVADLDGNKVDLQVWDYSPAAETDWTVGSWYYLEKVRLKEYSTGRELDATRRTEANEIGTSYPNGSETAETELLHLSDTHIGYTRHGVPEREADFADAFASAIDIAIDADVDGVVHTGDITHDSDPAEPLPDVVGESLSRLASHDIPFYYILGNHDLNEGKPQSWAATLSEFENAHHLTQEGTRVGNVTLYGLDYRPDEWWETPDISLSPTDADHDVLCLHQSVTPPVPERYGTVTFDSLTANTEVELDAVLLGHSHFTRDADVDGTHIQMAGATERTGLIYSDEQLLVHRLGFSDDGIEQIPEALNARPFATYTAILPEDGTAEAVLEEFRRTDLTEELVIVNVGCEDGTLPAEDAVTAIQELLQRSTALHADVRPKTIEFEEGRNPRPGVYSDPEAAVAEPTETGSETESGREERPIAGRALLDAGIAEIDRRADDACGFTLDLNQWQKLHSGWFHPHASADRNEVWECPHETLEGHTTCPLHTAPADRDESAVRSFLRDILTDGQGPCTLIGAELPPTDFSYTTFVDNVGDAIDLRAARVRGDLELRNMHISKPIFLIGADIEGDLTLTGSRFQGDFVARYLHVGGAVTAEFAVFLNRPRFRGSTFESGLSFFDTTLAGLSLPDVDVGGELRLKGATSTEKVMLSNTTCNGGIDATEFSCDDALHGKEITIADSLDLREADISGEVRLEQVTWQDVEQVTCAHARFDRKVNLTGLEAERLQCHQATFRRAVELSGITISGSATFDETHFEGTATFSGAVFSGETTFKRAKFGGRALFDRLVVQEGDGLRFDNAHFSTKTTFDGAHLGTELSLQNVYADGIVVLSPTSLTASVDCGEATFTGTFNCTPRGLDDTTSQSISLVETEMRAGELAQPAVGSVIYDLTEATLGEVDLTGEDEDSAEFLDSYKLLRTRFDGFRFEDHSCFVTADWEIHRTIDDDGEISPTDKRSTYLKAKNGAEAVGAAEAQRNFFIAERRARREEYDGQLSRGWAGNLLLDLVCEYGENYWRVIGTSLAVIVLFAFIIPVVQFLSRLSQGDAVTLSTLVAGQVFDTAPYEGHFGYLLISLESFTTMVFGGVSVTSPAVRFFAAAEGFLGAFLIALFLFTVTRSITR